MRQPPATILVVDDDPVCRRHAADVLGADGHRVELVGSVAEARAALSAARYDLVLCDLGLPDGTGAELARASDARIVAMSAELAQDRGEALMQLGFAAAVQKPLRAAVLLGLVRALTAGAAHEQALASGAIGDRVLDDEAALAVGGGPDVVASLRELLRSELPRQREALARALAAGAVPSARGVLHRLRAACGFCGAAMLERSTIVLSDALAAGVPCDDARSRFDAAYARTLDALEAPAAVA